MSWFDKLMPSRINTEKRRRSVPEGLWVKCEGCSAQLYRAELKRNLYVCPKCAHHLRIGARDRLNMFLDADSGEELAANLEPTDPLKFRDSKRYRDRLAQAQKATGERDALVVMAGTLERIPIVAAAFEFRFQGGSMGSVVGERFARAVNFCIEHERPFVCFSASGGARMQEALYSLMQMAKTSAALAALAEAGLPYISVMTDPTTGGVSASLAFLGDVNIAEPGSLIGFAGPRVIEQTVKERLPDGFQRAEFLVEKGALDMIVDRRRARREIAALLRKLLRLDAAHAADAERLAEAERAGPAGAAEPSEVVESVELYVEAEAEAAVEEAVAPAEDRAAAAEAAAGRKGKAKSARPEKAGKSSKTAKAVKASAAAAPAEVEPTEPGAAAADGGAAPLGPRPAAATGAAVSGPYRASGPPPGAAAPGSPIAPLPKQGAAPFGSGDGAPAPAETRAAPDETDAEALAEAEAQRKGQREEAETAAASSERDDD